MSGGLEVCVDSLAGLDAALRGGADRIELCQELAVGGLTPSPALIELAVERCRARGVPVHVMIRPRAGDFTYETAEVELMVTEIRRARQLGADGIVTGAIRNGMVDRPVVAAFVAAAECEVVFHRGFDDCVRSELAYDALTDLGCRGVLTSGGAAVAIDGLEGLRNLVQRSRGGGPDIIAGGGVRPPSIPGLLASGVAWLHTSASVPVAGSASRYAGISRGRTDEELVRACRRAMNRQEGT